MHGHTYKSHRFLHMYKYVAAYSKTANSNNFSSFGLKFWLIYSQLSARHFRLIETYKWDIHAVKEVKPTGIESILNGCSMLFVASQEVHTVYKFVCRIKW